AARGRLPQLQLRPVAARPGEGGQGRELPPPSRRERDAAAGRLPPGGDPAGHRLDVSDDGGVVRPPRFPQDPRQADRVPAEGEHERPAPPDVAAHGRATVREPRVRGARPPRSGDRHLRPGLSAPGGLRRGRAPVADGPADHVGRRAGPVEASRPRQRDVHRNAPAGPPADAAVRGPALTPQRMRAAEQRPAPEQRPATARRPAPEPRPALTPEGVLSALTEVTDPEWPVSIVDMGLVYGVAVEAGTVTLTLTFTATACPCMEMIQDDIRERLLRVPGVR